MHALHLAPLLAAALVAGCASVSDSARPEATTAADIAGVKAVLKRDFHARGIATMDRIDADEVQTACNLHGDAPPAEVSSPLVAKLQAAIRYPAGSLMGEWSRGRAIAESGRGMQWNDKPGAASGGSCYNCHQISKLQESYGTLGPSLMNYGKLRGNSPEMQRYTYGKIWNAKAYNPCSQMPRMGASGTLTEQQVKDLVAYLLDPKSPVNQ